METHSSILAWRTPWTEEPSGLQSIGSQRVGHNWVTGQQQLKEGLTRKMNWEQEAIYEIWEKNIPG